ncbi:phosphate ABC transporter substrate-binding protein [Psychrosphaera sp.]|nr:phosphate ABC transporter substrate-binding protein [Psychrosphaera sp.]
MKKSTIALVLALFSSNVLAVNVVVHPSNADALDKSAISRIFLGKAKSFPGGGTATPIDQAEGSAATNEFNDKVLSRSGSQLKAYWSKLVFTGKGTPPKKVDSDAAVIDMVSKNPDMIGYIQGDGGGAVKVVASF